MDLRFIRLLRFHNRYQIRIDLIVSLSAASISRLMDLLAGRRADQLEFVYGLRYRFTIICDGDSFFHFYILLNICQSRVVPLS